MAWYHQYISTEPGVQGGFPVVRGTRTPVRTIVTIFYEACSEGVNRVRESLPHLSNEQIDAALAFYRDNPSPVDEDIQRQKTALHEFLTRA